jgi:hypothetical protein
LNLSSDKSPHVPGQYFGYSLQPDRLLALLLSTGPGTTVSLEVFEDVGMQDASGAKTAEQTKSALASNPVGDRSDKLWKAFDVMVSLVKTLCNRRMNELETDLTPRVSVRFGP